MLGRQGRCQTGAGWKGMWEGGSVRGGARLGGGGCWHAARLGPTGEAMKVRRRCSFRIGVLLSPQWARGHPVTTIYRYLHKHVVHGVTTTTKNTPIAGGSRAGRTVSHSGAGAAAHGGHGGGAAAGGRGTGKRLRQRDVVRTLARSDGPGCWSCTLGAHVQGKWPDRDRAGPWGGVQRHM